jgi:hypothetical protein
MNRVAQFDKLDEMPFMAPSPPYDL